ncbi:hypothetical protein [Streptomyces sp. NPDC048172]|uniref:hypothetical protein n=1 Tax=Streptomyces sp. NPDC048172 TaxID=3365505 RepID=UPI0037154638
MGPRDDLLSDALAEAEAARERGDRASAESACERVLTLTEGQGPIAADALICRARLRLAEDAAEDAAEEPLSRARALAPEAWAPWYWSGCAAAHRAELDTAEGHFDAALACVTEEDDAGVVARVLVQRAYARALLDKPGPALDDLRRAADLHDPLHDPLDEAARRTAAVLARGRYEEACRLVRRKEFEPALDALVECEPWWPEGALNGAIAELRLYAVWQLAARRAPGARDRARTHLADARARLPDDPRPQHCAARLEFAARAYEDSATLWYGALTRHPDDPTPRHALALCRERTGDAEGADRELTALLDTESGPRARLALAGLRMREGRWGAAGEVLEEGAESSESEVLAECRYRAGEPPGSGGGAWAVAGLVRDGRTDEALVALDGVDARPGGRGEQEAGLLLRVAALRELGGTRWAEAASLLAAARELAPGPARSDADALHAVVLAMGGRHDAAAALLTEAARRRPADRHLAHLRALVLLHALSAGDGSAAVREQCVAAWGTLLHDAGFWERRRTDAERRHRTGIAPAHVVTLRTDLHSHLEACLRPPEGDDSGLLLRRESEAARALAGLGGFGGFAVDASGGERLVCGPLRIVELGMAREFGAYVCALGGPPSRRLFSQLGFAQVEFMADRPREALAALGDLRCAACAAAGDGTREAVAVCAPGCDRFDEMNPGYAGLPAPEKHGALREDALALAVEAALAEGRAALTAAEPDPRTAHACWRTALRYGRALGRYQDTQLKVADVALGSVAALRRAGRFDAAVSVLEAAHAILGANERHRLVGPLAGVLTDRGIVAFNAAPGELDGPLDDLRRAVEFNPHLSRAQHTLCLLLRLHGTRQRQAGSVTGALRTLRALLGRLDAALALLPHDAELERLRDGVRSDVAGLAAAAPDPSAAPIAPDDLAGGS